MVARAAADVALKVVPNLCLGWLGVLFEERRSGHHHAWRAVAALEAMVVLERLLDHTQRAILVGHALNGFDLSAIDIGRKHRARLHQLSVEVDGTGATLARVAAHMGARQLQLFAEKLNKQSASLNLTAYGSSVHGHAHGRHGLPSLPGFFLGI